MKLEETIQSLFNRYPELYGERWQALDHLFCGHGSGNHWVKGQLVSASNPPAETPLPLGEDGKAAVDMELINRRSAELKEELLMKERAARQAFFAQGMPKEEVDLLAPANEKIANDFVVQLLHTKRKKQPILFHIIDGGSPLVNIPEDVQPDWLEGVQETIELILKHGHGGSPQFWTPQQHEEHYYWTKELERMSQRFNRNKQ